MQDTIHIYDRDELLEKSDEYILRNLSTDATIFIKALKKPDNLKIQSKPDETIEIARFGSITIIYYKYKELPLSAELLYGGIIRYTVNYRNGTMTTGILFDEKLKVLEKHGYWNDGLVANRTCYHYDKHNNRIYPICCDMN